MAEQIERSYRVGLRYETGEVSLARLLDELRSFIARDLDEGLVTQKVLLHPEVFNAVTRCRAYASSRNGWGRILGFRVGESSLAPADGFLLQQQKLQEVDSLFVTG